MHTTTKHQTLSFLSSVLFANDSSIATARQSPASLARQIGDKDRDREQVLHACMCLPVHLGINDHEHLCATYVLHHTHAVYMSSLSYNHMLVLQWSAFEDQHGIYLISE